MALANPSVITVVSNTPQQLYTITTPFTNVPSFNSIGNQVVVGFTNTLTQVAGLSTQTIGVNLTTDVITLQPYTTYQLTALANIVNANQPSQYAFVSGGGLTLGSTVPMGQTISVTTASATTQTFTLVASTVNGTPWLYPAQISSAQVTVQAIAGWTE